MAKNLPLQGLLRAPWHSLCCRSGDKVFAAQERESEDREDEHREQSRCDGRCACVVATVRRPGHSIYDRIGLQDMTTDDVYYERGINLRHGYLAEYYVENADYIVTLPATLREVGVLLEPLTVAEKGLNQAYEIQRRLKVWQLRRAAVVGAGTIGLLVTLAMWLRGLEVTCYVSGVSDLVKAEAFYPGWLNKLLTTRVQGLENYEEMLRHLFEDKEAIKVYVEVATEE